MAVRVNNCVLVFGGMDLQYTPIHSHVIWVYNLYTEQWRMHRIPDKESAPALRAACAEMIGSDVYVFGGYDMRRKCMQNEVWKLSGMRNECFKWTQIDFQCNMNNLPAPRDEHSSWEYAECLYIFGGNVGDFTNYTAYLSDYGEFTFDCTNQLLCYVASTNKWTNPQCFGDVPEPRLGHSTVLVNNKVWLHGGLTKSFWRSSQDIFELDMLSYTWTRIKTGQTKPPGCIVYSSLTKISEKQLILLVHGGQDLPCETWVMDLSSYTWRKHSSNINDSRFKHKGCYGINRGVVIIGGSCKKSYTATFHMMLEPKSLQQLAMKAIYLHQYELPWKHLPDSLISQIGLSVNPLLISHSRQRQQEQRKVQNKDVTVDERIHHLMKNVLLRPLGQEAGSVARW